MNPPIRNLRYIKPDALAKSLEGFARGMAVTRGAYHYECEGEVRDIEWNHMDQLHRPFIHRTYEENIRLSTGRDFAVSLTRWGKWPFFITVNDVRVKEGVFHQSMTIGGFIFIQNIVAWTQHGDTAHLDMEWIIGSHRLFKPLHKWLDRKFTALNERLQGEDVVIREQRNHLRKKGYAFASDPTDYYNANLLTNNTLYPPLAHDAAIALGDIAEGERSEHMIGALSFLARRDGDAVLIWPGVCPHEGAAMRDATIRPDCKIECSWHGLKFLPAQLTRANPQANLYGFEYRLEDDQIRITQVGQINPASCPAHASAA